MLGKIVTSADTALGYEFCYALDMSREVVSESASDLSGGVVESEGEAELFVGVGSWGSHGV